MDLSNSLLMIVSRARACPTEIGALTPPGSRTSQSSIAGKDLECAVIRMRSISQSVMLDRERLKILSPTIAVCELKEPVQTQAPLMAEIGLRIAGEVFCGHTAVRKVL